MEMDINIDQAMVQKNELRQQITALKSHIKTSQTKLNQHTKKLQTMGEKKNKIKEELLNVQKKV